MKTRIGDKLGFLTVLEHLPKFKHNHNYIKVKCDCGKEKTMEESVIFRKTKSPKRCQYNCILIFPLDKQEFICTICKNLKPKNEMIKDKTTKYGIKTTCYLCEKQIRDSKKEYTKEYSKIYRNKLENKLKLKEYSYKYRQINKDKIIKKHIKYNEFKRTTDEIFKLKCTLRARLRKTLKNSYTKGIWKEVLGCSIEQLKQYLESKFQSGMTWKNHGLYGWHLDHIVPLSLAKTKEEVYKLCHYTNLQPLWAKENLIKSNKQKENI